MIKGMDKRESDKRGSILVTSCMHEHFIAQIITTDMQLA